MCSEEHVTPPDGMNPRRSPERFPVLCLAGFGALRFLVGVVCTDFPANFPVNFPASYTILFLYSSSHKHSSVLGGESVDIFQNIIEPPWTVSASLMNRSHSNRRTGSLPSRGP